MKRFFIFIAIAAIAPALFAQASAKPGGTPLVLPPGPLVKPLPPFVHCTITRKGTDDPAAAGQRNSDGSKVPISEQVVIEQTSAVGHVVRVLSNGVKREIWKKGGLQAIMIAGWKQPLVSMVEDDSEDVSWISASNFTGIQKVGGGNCMIFRDMLLPVDMRKAKVTPAINDAKSSEQALKSLPEKAIKALGLDSPQPTPANAAIQKVSAVACIDIDSRLPIALQVGGVVTTYNYEALPATFILNVPADIEAAFEANSQMIQTSTRRAVSP